MTARPTKSPPMVLVLDGTRYRGCILNRGKTGHEAFDATESSLGVFAEPSTARDAILKALAT